MTINEQQDERVVRIRDALQTTEQMFGMKYPAAEAALASLTTELAEAKAALEDCKHFLLQMRQESLGPMFGMANYKREAARLYDIARAALTQAPVKEKKKEWAPPVAAWENP